MVIRKSIIFIIAVILVYPLQAEIAPKYSNDFLSIGIGSRSFAMGNADFTSAQNATEVYINPSLTSLYKTPFSATLMHAEYFSGIMKYDFGAATYRIDSLSNIGLGFIRLGIDNILNTTDLIDPNGNIDYSKITYFSAADYALLFSFSRKIGMLPLSVGGNVKLIYRNVGKFADAYGFGFDLSATYILNRWRFAVNARDITSTFNFWTFNASELSIPDYVLPSGDTINNQVSGNSLELTIPRLQFGASYEFILPKSFKILAECGIEMTFDGRRNTYLSFRPITIDPRIGIEGSYNNIVFLRVGINNLQRMTYFENKTGMTLQPNAGLGVQYRGFALDYAISNIGNIGVSSYSHIFTLGFRWGEW